MKHGVVPSLPRNYARWIYAVLVLGFVGTIWAWLTLTVTTFDARGIMRLEGYPIDVVSQSGGRVAKLCVHEGSSVRHGDILVELDARDLLFKKRALETRIHFAELRSGSSAELAALYEQLKQIKIDIGSLTLTSPTDGYVTNLGAVHENGMLAAGGFVATIVSNARSLLIDCRLTPLQRRSVVMGQRVRLGSEGLTGTIVYLGANHVLIKPEGEWRNLAVGSTFNVHFRQEN